MKKKNILIYTFVILLLFVGLCVPRYVAKADSGFDSDWGSDSDSSDWGSDSSWDSDSDWDSDYGSYSSGSSYTSSSSKEFSIWITIVMELFCSVHYFIFAFIPLASLFTKKEKTTKLAAVFMGIRIIILIIGDIITKYFAVFDFILLFILVFVVVPVLSAIMGKKNQLTEGDDSNLNSIDDIELTYNDLSDSILNKFNINSLSILKEELFENYKEVQNAWMNFDYDKLRTLVTDEMYNMYESQLKTLEIKKQKNIMSDIEKVEVKIYDVIDNKDEIEIKAYMRVCMYDYLVDVSNNVLRGNKNKKINIAYEIYYIKGKGSKYIYCPNCGAKLENNASNKCEYCNSIITSTSSNIVMSSKTSIGQK